MSNTFYTWDDFRSNFGREMREAVELYEQMAQNGCKDLALAKFDVTFESDSKEKLEALSAFLTEHYQYEMFDIESEDGVWELNGTGAEIPVTEEFVLYWVLDMADRGYEFDAKLSGYGAESPGDDAAFPELSETRENEYFDAGIAAYDIGNRTAALVNWSLAILVNGNNADSYYSRAIVKNDLHTWKAALRDYDEAIRLAPDFLAALNNRGTVKDDNNDPEGALADYNKVITLAGDDAEQMALAHFNRGNTKHRLGDKQGACEDWKRAQELGADYAAERIQSECGKQH